MTLVFRAVVPVRLLVSLRTGGYVVVSYQDAGVWYRPVQQTVGSSEAVSSWDYSGPTEQVLDLGINQSRHHRILVHTSLVSVHNPRLRTQATS